MIVKARPTQNQQVTPAIFLFRAVPVFRLFFLASRVRYGMNLDMGVIAALTAGCSVFGLPWLVAATVRSLAHVKSLTKYEQLGWGKERIAGVAEQR